MFYLDVHVCSIYSTVYQGSYLPALHFGSVPDPPEEISEEFRICVALVRETGHFGPKNVEIPENQAIWPRFFFPEFPGSFPKSSRNFSDCPQHISGKCPFLHHSRRSRRRYDPCFLVAEAAVHCTCSGDPSGVGFAFNNFLYISQARKKARS
jgi:hypothetical protein